MQNNNPWTYPYRYKNNTFAYISDVLNTTDKLIVSAAVRVDHFHNLGNFGQSTGKYSGKYEQTSFSPKFGLAYQPIKNKISLFANYQNGFTNVAGTDYKGRTFNPNKPIKLKEA